MIPDSTGCAGLSGGGDTCKTGHWRICYDCMTISIALDFIINENDKGMEAPKRIGGPELQGGCKWRGHAAAMGG